ncbi:hypothetical protein O988_06059 [Pseudogymnoascus sp. VKM F-3808]|nr:hypothetical protein O988_06059 [Pseudogymnoascus sp. VKM F-3808]
MDPLIYDIQVERGLHRPEVAMDTLQRAASLVKPLMRAHNFKVGLLAEFLPKERGLLGLNTGGGRIINVRLRHATDPTQFFTFNMIMDTVLHELCHNRFGPHDANFHALWDQLRDEFSALMQSGFTGDAFRSQGYFFGNKKIRGDEARRIARTAVADYRMKLSLTGNPKLTGAGPKPSIGMNGMAKGGAFERVVAVQGCRCDMPKAEQKALVAAASVNVIKSRAREDDASEVAIQEALWEIAQEDRVTSSKQKVASQSSASNRRGNYSEDPSLSKPPPQYVQLIDEEFWQCETCTLINKEEDVYCDACATARPGTEPPSKSTPRKAPSKAVAKKTPYKTPPAKTSTRTRPSSSRAGPSRKPAKSGVWLCSCSLINKEERACCAACGITRPGS